MRTPGYTNGEDFRVCVCNEIPWHELPSDHDDDDDNDEEEEEEEEGEEEEESEEDKKRKLAPQAKKKIKEQPFPKGTPVVQPRFQQAGEKCGEKNRVRPNLGTTFTERPGEKCRFFFPLQISLFFFFL